MFVSAILSVHHIVMFVSVVFVYAPHCDVCPCSFVNEPYCDVFQCSCVSEHHCSVCGAAVPVIVVLMFVGAFVPVALWISYHCARCLAQIRVEMTKERALALKSQEERLGAMITALQMEKAREVGM